MGAVARFDDEFRLALARKQTVCFRAITSFFGQSFISPQKDRCDQLRTFSRALKRISNHLEKGWRCLLIANIGLGASCLPVFYEAEPQAERRAR